MQQFVARQRLLHGLQPRQHLRVGFGGVTFTLLQACSNLVSRPGRSVGKP